MAAPDLAGGKGRSQNSRLDDVLLYIFHDLCLTLRLKVINSLRNESKTVQFSFY